MAMAGKWAGAALVAVMITTGGAALALGKGRGPDFATLDADGDGQITQSELQMAAQSRFSAADADGNGTLSAQELTRSMTERASDRVAKMIERFDANGDGELALDEMPRRGGGDRGARMISRFDSNGDGAISEDEFNTMREARAKHHGHGKHGHRDHN